MRVYALIAKKIQAALDFHGLEEFQREPADEGLGVSNARPISASVLFAMFISHKISEYLANTKRSLLFSAPRYSCPQGEVWFFPGAPVPFILRPKGNGNHEYIGPAYIHGLMYREIFPEYGFKIEDAREITLE